jgi:hypothetical protein
MIDTVPFEHKVSLIKKNRKFAKLWPDVYRAIRHELTPTQRVSINQLVSNREH